MLLAFNLCYFNKHDVTPNEADVFVSSGAACGDGAVSITTATTPREFVQNFSI